MAVLYRKYRPQTFADVLNQKPIIQTLKNQVTAGSVAHAYLFTGSRGVGKTSVARILAKAVNCLRPVESDKLKVESGDACGVCENCKAIAAGNFLDLLEIDAASNTGVDNIRELIEHVKFSPTSGKYKVFIIDEVHMLSKGAFNALLKTLEEPPLHAIFVLATTEINKVPATIVSRTQRFDFKALSASDLFNHLQKISRDENLKFSREILELVAQNAEGSVRDALSLLDKVITLGEQVSLAECQQLLGITDIATCENLLDLIVRGQADLMPEFFARLAENGLDYLVLNRDFLEFLRKTLIYKVTEGRIDFALGEERVAKIKAFSEKLQVQDLIFITRLFLKAYKDLGVSPSQEIPLLLAGIEAALRKNPSLNLKPTPVLELKPEIKNNYAPIRPPELKVELIEEPEPVISLSEVEIVWPKVLDKIKAVNGPLASMLRAAQLQKVLGSRIVVGVKFLFDKQNLENPKNASLISFSLEEITAKKLGVSAQVLKIDAKGEGTAAEVLSDALKVFGGELIE